MSVDVTVAIAVCLQSALYSTGRLAQIGAAMETEPRRYEGMVRAPTDTLPCFGTGQVHLRQQQATQAATVVACPICGLDVHCCSIWELVTHLLATHKRDDYQPWLHGGGDHSAVKQTLGWVNKHLVLAKSPLAVQSVLDEYDGRTCANVVNNNSAAVRSIIKSGNTGKKGTPAASLVVVGDNAKCPCFDNNCPAPAPDQGRWTPRAIAEHAVAHHRKMPVCKWHSVYKCDQQRPASMGVEALAEHIREHQTLLNAAVVPENYAERLEEIKEQRAEAGPSTSTSVTKRRYGE